MPLSDRERRLLEKLADAGKATRLLGDELELAKALEEVGLVCLVSNTADAVITPRGRHRLAGIEIGNRPKKPFGFTE